MKINIFLFIAIIGYHSRASSQSAKELIVERFSTSDYGGSYIKPITVLLEKRKYSKKQILYKVEYKSKFIFDSTTYKFEFGKLIRLTKFTNFNSPGNSFKKIEDISFIYKNGMPDGIVEHDGQTKLTEEEKREYYLNYLKSNDIFSLRDSLGLLEKEFCDLNLPNKNKIKTRKINGLTEKIYNGDYLPNILFEYGVPHDTYLENIFVYFNEKDKLLMKDVFLYEKVTVQRRYQYSNGIINNIRVVVVDSHKKTIRNDFISFRYKNG